MDDRGVAPCVLLGPGGDLPATGRTVRVGFIQVVRHRGGRIASFHIVFDRVELLEQLGLAPSSEAEHARPADMASRAPSVH